MIKIGATIRVVGGMLIDRGKFGEVVGHDGSLHIVKLQTKEYNMRLYHIDDIEVVSPTDSLLGNMDT